MINQIDAIVELIMKSCVSILMITACVFLIGVVIKILNN